MLTTAQWTIRLMATLVLLMAGWNAPLGAQNEPGDRSDAEAADDESAAEESDAQDADQPANDEAPAEEGEEAEAEELLGSRLFERLDRNGDGKLSRAEFPRRLRDRFNAVDSDGDGSVSPQEFRDAMRAVADRASPSSPNTAAHADGEGPLYADDAFLYQPIAGPFEIERQATLTLTDAARDDKALDLRVTWPLVESDGALPLIVFSHGAGGSKDGVLPLTEYWAKHGYIVIQPTHEDSIQKQDGGLRAALEMVNDPDVRENRVKDLVFVLDSLDAIEGEIEALKDRIDEQRIGISGHSFGAYTTMLMQGMSTKRADGTRKDSGDDRPLAFLTLSPQGTDNLGIDEQSWQTCTRPWMTMSGTKDTTRKGADAVTRRDPFLYAPKGGKFEVWIEGAQHATFTGRLTEGRSASAEEQTMLTWVQAASLAFWDGYLQGVWASRGYIGSHALPLQSEGRLELNHKLGSSDAPKGLEAAIAYSAEHGGKTLLIAHRGEVIGSDTSGRFTLDTPIALASGTKSFWGVLAQIAIEEGLFELDDLACDTLSEWQEDVQKSKITIRQLLNLTSGLAPSQDELQGPTTYSKYEHALGLPMNHDAGEAFAYGPSHYFAFGELLKRKLAEQDTTVDAYLHEKLLDPLGLEVGHWTQDKNGEPLLPHGAYLSANQWVKFGELIRMGGKAPASSDADQDGEDGAAQIISTDKLLACFHGCDKSPAYGLTFWLIGGELASADTPVGERLPHDAIMAAGKGKQRLYVIPSLDLVIVRQGEESRPVFDDAEFFKHLFSEPEQGDG